MIDRYLDDETYNAYVDALERARADAERRRRPSREESRRCRGKESSSAGGGACQDRRLRKRLQRPTPGRGAARCRRRPTPAKSAVPF